MLKIKVIKIITNDLFQNKSIIKTLFHNIQINKDKSRGLVRAHELINVTEKYITEIVNGSILVIEL